MLTFIKNFLKSNSKIFEQQQKTILSAAFIITIANVFSSLAGLVRERLLIQSFFYSETAQQSYEAFQVAFQIPDMLFQLIVLGAVSAAFIPVFTSLKKQDEQKALLATANFMNILLLIFVVASAIVFVFAKPLTAWRTGQAFSASQVEIASNLTKIMLLAQLLFAVSNFLTGLLQSYQRFVLPALSPVLYNLGIVLGVYAFSHWIGIYSAGVGVVIGAILHMLVQLPLAYKLGFRFRVILNFKLPSVKQFFRLVPLRVLTLSVGELQNLALGFFATSVGNLSFVAMKLALRLMALPIRLFGVPISQASLPFLSEESADQDKEAFRKLITQSLNQITFLSMPASMLLLILRLPIVRLIFGAKDFPWATTVLVGKILAILAISISIQAMAQLLFRAFHALKDTKTPFLVALGSMSMYLFLSWWGIFYLDLGVLAIAGATFFTAFFETILFMILLNKRIGNFLLNKELLFAQIKIILASFLMAVFLYLPYRILDELVFNTSKTIELIALSVSTSTIGMLVYIYFAMLFDVKELKYLTMLFNKFGKWQLPFKQSKELIMEAGSEEFDI